MQKIWMHKSLRFLYVHFFCNSLFNNVFFTPFAATPILLCPSPRYHCSHTCHFDDWNQKAPQNQCHNWMIASWNKACLVLTYQIIFVLFCDAHSLILSNSFLFFRQCCQVICTILIQCIYLLIHSYIPLLSTYFLTNEWFFLCRTFSMYMK